MLCAMLTAVLVAAVGPPPPPDVGEGDYVELDGVYYQRKDGVLYTLDDPHLEEAKTLTVTGSRLDKDRKKKLIRAEVIDGDAMRETGARTLADVLEEHGGLQVNSSVGLGSEVFMDGLDGRHVLILIDGRPVNGKTNNRVDVSRLPVSAANIERIEIVRGPMSALYGSDALGGVINIITKKADGDGALELEGGGEVDVGGQLLPGGGGPWTSLGAHGHGSFGPGALRLDLTAQNMPGYDRGGVVSGDTVPDGRNDVPDRRNTSVSADFSVQPTKTWTLRTSLLAMTADTSATVA
ncbi:MAG TPA: TonB-dependent receptor plug domain-containing protein, partial [Myxococcota bacterium]